jgi:hypothetical protein
MARGFLLAIVNMGKSILVSPQEQVQAQRERQNRLERMYMDDGRNDPKHPYHSLYTGLKQGTGNTN